MQKELLLAIGDDRAASYNLRFLHETFSGFCDMRLTLFYVAPKLTSMQMLDNAQTPTDENLDKLLAHKKDKGEKALAEAMKWVKDITGCDGKNITTKVVMSRKGTVGELVDEARSGLYDALLLGRKGFSWFEEVFTDSVTNGLFWESIDFPIWVCKQPSPIKRKGVLVCMDSSNAAMRMADHVGYMLAGEDHPITLFHATGNGADQQHPEFFEQALDALRDNGISDDQVELKTVPAANALKGILDEVRTGNYAAVCAGRRDDSNPSRMETMFPSSITINLLRQLKDTALWISK